MRRTVIIALLGAALLAAPAGAPAADLPELPAPLPSAPPLPRVPELPPVPELPRVPELPQVPELPEAPELPKLPELSPVPKAPEVPVSPPEALPAKATPAARPAAPAPSAPSAGDPPASAETPSRPAADRAPRRRRSTSATPRRPEPRDAPRRISRAPVTLASQPVEPAVAAAPTEERGRAERIADGIGELVKALPSAILWALGGLGVLALWLALSAYRQSRRRAALEAQRALLLDDIGLLSGALLPPVPDGLDGLAGLDVTAAYRPADGPAAGGDFYDVFGLEDGRVGVLLGDVSGHGRDSVQHAALARYTLRTLLADGHPVGEALAHADRLLVTDMRPQFVTVIAAIYDLERGRLTYAKAGHPPPIVLGAAHDPETETPAPPIGLGLGVAWPEYHVDLADGATVCLFTDGLEDARVDGGRLGRCEVERLLSAHDVPDAERLLGDVRAAADSVGDDTAAVVLHRRPQAADFTDST